MGSGSGRVQADVALVVGKNNFLSNRFLLQLRLSRTKGPVSFN